jgi:hypothetical protein
MSLNFAMQKPKDGLYLYLISQAKACGYTLFHSQAKACGYTLFHSQAKACGYN